MAMPLSGRLSAISFDKKFFRIINVESLRLFSALFSHCGWQINYSSKTNV